jgi:hypothetical protein
VDALEICGIEIKWSVHKMVSTYTVVRFVVITAVAMKKAVFWDVTPCG